MNMLSEREAEAFPAATRRSQVLVGILLLVFTVFADFYFVRDFLWIYERIRLQDVEPALSTMVLAITPWLVLVSYRLITGAYEHRDLFSPFALILLGVGFCVAAALGWRSGFFRGALFAGRALIGMLALGAGAVGLGWYRARQR